MNSHSRVLAVLTALLLVQTFASVPLASAQTRDLSRVRTLAVAPFADYDPTTRPQAERGAARLSNLLRAGPFHIVEAPRVAAEMERAGVRAPDLISPSRAVELGMRLGADAVLTGRVVQIYQERQR